MDWITIITIITTITLPICLMLAGVIYQASNRKATMEKKIERVEAKLDFIESYGKVVEENKKLKDKVNKGKNKK